MTTIYYVRHAQPNCDNHDDLTRELTPKGLEDRGLVARYLRGVPVDGVLSSPCLRAVDTVRPLARERGLTVRIVDGLQERVVGGWLEDFDGYVCRQWQDFSYKRPGGESLGEVQARNLRALEEMLEEHRGQTLVVGGHGTALSTLIHHFDPAFGYDQFSAIQSLMPWLVKFVFRGRELAELEKINLFAL